MAFQVINSNEIDVGDPIRKELWDKVKNSLDDLDERTNELESGASKISVFKFPVLNAASANTFTGLAYYIADENFTLTSASITIFEKGSLTGALEIDVEISTTNLAAASFSSVFTTRPKITWSTATDYATSTNQVFDNTKIAVSVGDILRFDITEMPSSGVLGKFIVNVFGEK